MYYGRGQKNPCQAEKPMFPFGFGLSYTTFDYTDMQLSNSSIDKGGKVNVTATVRNTGSRDGAEVVQLYANFNGNTNYGKAGNLRRRLVGFARVEVPAGQTATVQIPVEYEQLAYFNEQAHNFQVAGGTVTLELAASSEDIRLTKNLNAEAGVAKETYLSNGSTPIETVKSSRQLAMTDHIYTVMGAYVGPASIYDQLPSGVYVVNAHKYIKKD